MLEAVPLEQRFGALATALDRLLEAVAAQGLSETIAFTELHNELDFSMLPQPEDSAQRVAHPLAYEALTWLEQRHPQQLFTLSFGRPDTWKLQATVITDQMIYGYDTVDRDRWDQWLNQRYPQYRESMLEEIESRVTAIAGWGDPMWTDQSWTEWQIRVTEEFRNHGRTATEL